jgi:hypothetical protein
LNFYVGILIGISERGNAGLLIGNPDVQTMEAVDAVFINSGDNPFKLLKEPSSNAILLIPKITLLLYLYSYKLRHDRGKRSLKIPHGHGFFFMEDMVFLLYVDSWLNWIFNFFI